MDVSLEEISHLSDDTNSHRGTDDEGGWEDDLEERGAREDPRLHPDKYKIVLRWADSVDEHAKHHDVDKMTLMVEVMSEWLNSKPQAQRVHVMFI